MVVGSDANTQTVTRQHEVPLTSAFHMVVASDANTQNCDKGAEAVPWLGWLA